MSNNLDKDGILAKIAKLDALYKEKSLELVGCRSFAKEQKIKEEMNECEVKRKVLKRKLEELEEERA